MTLPQISGEFGIVQPPELRFSDNGRAWMKIRGVAKDRRRGANGEWEDGDVCYMDILVNGKQAENLAESVEVGDAINVTGDLTMREVAGDDGKKQKFYSIRAKQVGVSVQFTPVRPAARASAPAPAVEEGSPF